MPADNLTAASEQTTTKKLIIGLLALAVVFLLKRFVGPRPEKKQ